MAISSLATLTAGPTKLDQKRIPEHREIYMITKSVFHFEDVLGLEDVSQEAGEISGPPSNDGKGNGGHEMITHNPSVPTSADT